MAAFGFLRSQGLEAVGVGQAVTTAAARVSRTSLWSHWHLLGAAQVSARPEEHQAPLLFLLGSTTDGTCFVTWDQASLKDTDL